MAWRGQGFDSPRVHHFAPLELRGARTIRFALLERNTKTPKSAKWCPAKSRRSGALEYNLPVYYVYVLRVKNGTYYTGYTSDMDKRMKEHEEGSVRATKNLRPIELMYYSAFISKKKALDFERYLKSSSGFAFRNKRML